MPEASLVTQEQWESLCTQQRDLEDNALALGGERFRRRLQQAQEAGKASTVGAAKKLLQEGIVPLEAAIEAVLAESESRGKGRRHAALKWFELVGPDVAAYMTIKCVLDSLPKQERLADTAGHVAQMIVDELRYRRLQKEAPGLFKYAISRFQTSSYAHMTRSLTATVRHSDVDVSDLHMDRRTKIIVGSKLIDLMIQSTGLVHVVSTTEQTKGRGKRRKVTKKSWLEATPETIEWMIKRNDALEFMTPEALPMVMPPLQWTPEQRGGYRYALRNKFHMIRTHLVAAKAQALPAGCPITYEAVNHIQNTPWRINRDVMALALDVQRSGQAFAGLPAFEEEPMPARPEDIAENEEARKAWRKAAHNAKNRNHVRRGKALKFAKILSIAEMMKDQKAIFFPHSLDFRGRVYPLSEFLSPQGDDLSRGLLTFSDARALGLNGARWLAVHGANCLGDTPQGQKVSKMSFSERVQWIRQHEQQIRDVVSDPFGATWWSKADKPLQFYAFCCEWVRYLDSGSGEAFVSGLPVSQDGSCNGLQHLSAMLRDEIGGKAVNLIPSDVPEDCYQRIADEVLTKLELVVSGSPVAAKWLQSGLIGRKLVKRPTMTFSYGSKKYGFREQLIEYLTGLENWPEVRVLFTNENGKSEISDACTLLSALIWESLRDVVVAAFHAMAWMQQAARLIAKDDKTVHWIVPSTGFRVEQGYYQLKMHRVKTVLAGSIVAPSFQVQTAKVEAYKQINAIAPNFVHSMDAAALQMTVVQAAAEGIESFGMIHDSYATVAGDVTLLGRITRQQFVKLYTDTNVIENLREQFKEQMGNPEDCPAPPKMGNLDPSAVLVSDYFFA